MSTWEPISEKELLGLIENSEWSMNEFQKSLWNIIKLNKPEKWTQHPWGDQGNGFWVVATYGNKCLYYNDIEEGFNESPFNVWGNIEEYFSNQIELHEFIGSIMEYRLNIT
jgi:hypothetical protein